MTEFEKNTNHRITKDGYSIRCKKGLWAVHAPNKAQATMEAVRYFIQYWEDGEYDEQPNKVTE